MHLQNFRVILKICTCIFQIKVCVTFKKFIDFKNPSVLARKNIKNSNWFKKEGHNIKLLSLSALGSLQNKPFHKQYYYLYQLS